MSMPNDIKVGVPFQIEKGGRCAWWKIIRHPYFDDAFALVADHPYLMSGLWNFDEKHIVDACKTVEDTWERAYDHT